jgi:M6 family metalloprotease-like protein
MPARLVLRRHAFFFAAVLGLVACSQSELDDEGLIATTEQALWSAGGLPSGIAAQGAGSVVAIGNDLHVFFRTADGRLKLRSRTGSTWAASDLTIGTAILSSDPSAVSWGPRRIDVFYRTSTGALGQAWRDLDVDTVWRTTVHADRPTGAPAVVSRSLGMLDVVYVDGSGRILSKLFLDGAWRPPFVATEPPLKPLGGTISAIALDPRTINIVGRLTTGEVELFGVHFDDDGLPLTVTPVIRRGEIPGAANASSLAVASWAGDRLDVFHVRGNELRWCVHRDFHGAGAEEVVATNAHSVAAVASNGNAIEVVYRNTSGVLQHRRYTSSLLLATPAAAYKTVPLYSWWSPGRGDLFTTSDPAWAPTTTTRAPDYVFQRYEGYVFDPASPQPPDTVPLHSWYSPSRGDNFVTSDPAWSPASGTTRAPDYRFVRLEGYVYTRPFMGTLPLRSWWNGTVEDNRATTDPEWSGRNGREGYGFYRSEGFVLPDPRGARASDALAKKLGFDAWSLKGKVPVLHVSTRWSKAPHPVPTESDDAVNRRLIFGNTAGSATQPRSTPNLFDYALENSNGLFTFSVAGPTIVANIDADVPTDRPPLGDADGAANERAAALPVVKADRQLDFGRFDTNRNNRIEPRELAIVLTDNRTLTGGANRGLNGCCKATANAECLGLVPGQNYCMLHDEKIALNDETHCVKPFGREYKICTRTAAVASARKRIDLIAHEAFHTFGAEDIYSKGRASEGLSLMSSAGTSVHLDPAHKIRFGWVRPRAHSVYAPPGVLYLEAQRATDTDASAPIALLDPDGEPDALRHYLFEARSRAQTSNARYDLGVSGDGVVPWYFQRIGSSDHRGRVLEGCGPSGVRAPVSIGAALTDCGTRFGNNQPWTEATPEAQPFLGGHAAIAISVRRHPSERGWFLQLRRADDPVLARLDTPGAGMSLTRGTSFVATGVFPFEGTTFRLMNGGRLDLLSFTPMRAAIQIAADAPLGATTLRVSRSVGLPATTTAGAELPVTIR